MTRDLSLDVAKVLSMFFIVLIHVWTNSSNEYGAIVGLDNFLTTFVLALFILVSGYLSRKLILSHDGGKLVFRVVACVWPVLTMMVLLGQVFYLFLFGRFQAPAMGWARYVLSVGWFFFCLSSCLALTFFADWIARGRKIVLGVLLAVLLVALWAAPVGFCHTKDMIVYFWFGVYAYPAYVSHSHRRLIGFGALAVSVGVCGLLPDFREIGLFVHDAVMPQGAFTWVGCGLALAKYALGLTATLGVLEFSHLLAPFVRNPDWVTAISARTMGIFYIHIQLLGVYYSTIGWMGGGFAGRLTLASVLFAVSYVFAVLTRLNATVGAILWNPLEFLSRKGAAR